jgi:hypothetical protein
VSIAPSNGRFHSTDDLGGDLGYGSRYPRKRWHSREPTPDTPAVGPPRQASSYSDTELRSFALAALNVERIKNLYLSKLEAATTPEQQQEVRKAAEQPSAAGRMDLGAHLREVRLPEGADPHRIRARMNDGVLEVSVPRPTCNHSRRVDIQP